MTDKCPCKECDRRTLSCHVVCRDYNGWKARLDQAKRELCEKNGQYTDKALQPFWRKMDRRYSRGGR